MKTRIALCWAIGVLAISALLYGNARTRPTEVEARPIPLPEIAHQPIRLCVAHAINPRLPRLSAEQIAETLALARADARSTFAVELEFEPVVEIPIGDLFDRIPRRLTDMAHEAAYRRRVDAISLAGLREDFAEQLRSHPELVAAYRTYIGELLPERTADLAGALAEIQHERLLHWRALTATDGHPVIDDKPYNEYTYWNMVGYVGIPYDLVFTNQLVASVERGDAVVYSGLRGGVTLGGTTYNRGSATRTFSFVTTFAMTSDDQWVRSLRGEKVAPEVVSRYVEVVLLHELGHQLFHYADLFDVPACVMQPVRLLRFWESAFTVVPDGCPKSHPQMQRGAAAMYYWPSWEN